jgi:hypothetical protein
MQVLVAVDMCDDDTGTGNAIKLIDKQTFDSLVAKSPGSTLRKKFRIRPRKTGLANKGQVQTDSKLRHVAHTSDGIVKCGTITGSN